MLYHDECSDGFCAAWVWRTAYPDAEFVPVRYGEPPPPVEPGRPVAVLDFSYPEDQLRNLVEATDGYLIVLDHHKSAAPVLTSPEFAAYCEFAADKSGGRMAWEYVWRAGMPVRPGHRFDDPPWLIRYTEDRDLWRWVLPNSKEINAVVRSYPFDFLAWDALAAQAPGLAMAAEGSAVLRSERRVIDAHKDRAVPTRMFGFDGVPVVNCSARSVISEVTGELAAGRPFAASYYDARGVRVWSLRSDGGGEDVAELAKKVGGGGHKRAAGFEQKLSESHDTPHW